MKRGDVVLVAPPGDFGKPRPSLATRETDAAPIGEGREGRRPAYLSQGSTSSAK